MVSWDIIVDNEGRVWETRGYDLARHFGASVAAEFDLPRYLVRNLGCARILLSRTPGSLRLTFRPGLIGLQTVERVISIMLAQRVATIVVEMIDDVSALQTFRSVDDVAALLAEHSDVSSRLRRLTFFREPISFERLALRRRAWLADLYGHWQKFGGDLDRVRSDAGYHFSRQEFSALIRGDVAAFDEIGTGYTNLPHSLDGYRGRPVGEQPDRVYGSWVSECLMTIRHRRMPRFELVEATVSLPAAQPRRIRYERLMLPWTTRVGDVVSSASVTRAAFGAYSAT